MLCCTITLYTAQTKFNLWKTTSIIHFFLQSKNIFSFCLIIIMKLTYLHQENTSNYKKSSSLSLPYPVFNLFILWNLSCASTLLNLHYLHGLVHSVHFCVQSFWFCEIYQYHILCNICTFCESSPASNA